MNKLVSLVVLIIACSSGWWLPLALGPSLATSLLALAIAAILGYASGTLWAMD